MEFNDRLRTLRRSQNLSRGRLAEIVGVTEQTIYRYESGERQPTIDTAIQLAFALNVDMNMLLGFEPMSNNEWDDDDMRDLDIFKTFLRMRHIAQ